MSEWIEWAGGECPVPPNTLVEVKLRSGYTTVEKANRLRWYYTSPVHDPLCDITTYRVLGQQPERAVPEPLPSVGVKHDQGKPMAGLMLTDFSRALEAVASVTTFGAGKYSPSGWLAVPEAERRYTDALCRHLLADLRGEVTDSESGLPHLAHAAWNVLAVLELQMRGRTD